MGPFAIIAIGTLLGAGAGVSNLEMWYETYEEIMISLIGHATVGGAKGAVIGGIIVVGMALSG